MKKTKLKDICNISAGGTPSRSNINYWNNGDIPWCKIGDFSGKYINQVKENITEEGLKNSSAKIFKRGTILYTIFATVGEVAILEIESATNQAIAGLELINNEVDLEYLYYYLKSLKFLMLKKSRGVAQNNINLGILKNIEIKIPDKIEQINIAKILDNIEKIIDKKKKQLKELNAIIKSQFVEMFEDIKIKEKMKNVSVYFSRGKTPNYVEKSNIKVISQACIYWDEFKYEKAKYQDENKALKALEKMIENGDVLITSTGTGTLGRCNVYYGENHKYMADSHVSILRLNYREVNPIFFKYYFMQEKVQKELYAECVNGSTNQIELSKDRFLNFRILIPEITLQNQFSEIVKQIDKQKFESMIQLDKENRIVLKNIIQLNQCALKISYLHL